MAKVLIAYYSRRGENSVNGSIKNLKLGNTEVVAGMLKGGARNFVPRPSSRTAHPSTAPRLPMPTARQGR